MKILSVNVGLPREVLSGKDIVTTGIFKEPVKGPVKLRKLNLDGDKQADLTVHGCISLGALRLLASSSLGDVWRKSYHGIMLGESCLTCRLAINNISRFS